MWTQAGSRVHKCTQRGPLCWSKSAVSSIKHAAKTKLASRVKDSSQETVLKEQLLRSKPLPALCLACVCVCVWPLHSLVWFPALPCVWAPHSHAATGLVSLPLSNRKQNGKRALPCMGVAAAEPTKPELFIAAQCTPFGWLDLAAHDLPAPATKQPQPGHAKAAAFTPLQTPEHPAAQAPHLIGCSHLLLMQLLSQSLLLLLSLVLFVVAVHQQPATCCLLLCVCLCCTLQLCAGLHQRP